MKSILDAYWDFGSNLSLLNSRIDLAQSYGADTYEFEFKPEYLWQVKGATDQVQNAIVYAHSKGMKVHLKISWYKWATGEDRTLFYNTPSIQAQYLLDFEWIVARYLTADGINIEEPSFYTGSTDGGLAFRNFWNNLHTQMHNIIVRYRNVSNPDLFAWYFTVSSNMPSNIALGGTDVNYINSNQLYNSYMVSNGGSQIWDVPKFVSTYNVWKPLLPSLKIMTYVFVTDDGTQGLCKAAGYDGWTNYTCYNQGFFNQLKYTRDNNIDASIFTMGLLGTPSIYFPNEPTPGTTAGNKVKSIWSSAPVPPPMVYVAPCGIVGDIDGDGNITQADVDLASQLLLSGGTLTADQIKRIDVNGDGVANLNDLVLLKQYSLGQITTFPACNPPCISSGYICEQPLNGYEKDNCGNRRLNTACNPPPVLNSIVISPSMIQINQGQETAVTVKAIDSNGVAVPGVPVIITSDPTGIITTNPTQGGTFTDGTITITVKGLIPGLTALKAASGSIVGISTIDVNSNPCISAWVCEVPLNGWEKDGCGNRRLNPVCNVPGPTDDKTEQVIFVAIAIGAALSKL